MRIKIKNLIRFIADQGPILRLWKNIRSGAIKGAIHRRSHFTRHDTPKIMYNTKSTADRACKSMARKHNGKRYVSYKCLYCDGFHIGSRRNHYE